MCAVTLAAALALTGCQSVRDMVGRHIVLTSAESYLSEVRSKATPKVSSSATKTEGVLTVGLRASQTTPLVIPQEGKVCGLDVDLACALADELGLRVSFVTVSDVRSGLEGSCDIVMGAAELDAIGFGIIGDYTWTSMGLFQRGADAPQALAEQVRGTRIGVQTGSAAQLTLSHLDIGATEVTYNMLTDVFDALARGDVDFVACNSSAGEYVCVLRGGCSFAGAIDTPKALGIAMANGEDELRAALSDAYARMQSNGLLDAIRAPWVGTSSRVGLDSQIADLDLPAPVEEVLSEQEPEPMQDQDMAPAEGEEPVAEDTPTEVNAGGNAVML